MSEWLVVVAIALVGASGLLGLCGQRTSAIGERVAAALVIAGSVCGLVGATATLVSGSGVPIDRAWAVPGARFAVHTDALSAMFLVQIFTIAPLGSIYGLSYWRQAEHPNDGRKLRLAYGLIVAGLALLVVARNAILFFFGWEMMAVAAFFAVTTDDRQRAVREAGLVYLVATRVSALCLLALFAVYHAATRSFDFDAFARASLSPAMANAVFLLALTGFGLKAGLFPLHVWLPGAHANAPSHVSALMSGVLIKMGIYGLLRVCSFFAQPPAWWGGLLIAMGATSGILGVAFAIGQHDLKRLLAYHSVENIGIIVLGIGLAILGRALRLPELMVLGLGGALLHVWNHGLFKALLFFSAGAVVHATGTREMDRLGGLAKKMPATALYFLIGAAAISGLPPLNGFVSEYLLYLGMFQTVAVEKRQAWLVAAFGAPALALIGALAAGCFVKAFGAVFLGEARTHDAAHAHDAGHALRGPMFVLAAGCVLIGLAPALIAVPVGRAIAAWAPESAASGATLASVAPLGWLTLTGLALVVLVTLGAVVLRALGRRAPASRDATWDCGYALPSSAMQYTSSSFAQTLVGYFAWALRPVTRAPDIRGPFPPSATFHSRVPDTVLDRMVLPLARSLGRAFYWFRWVQRGSVHAYVLYILTALVLSLLWWR